ncbi:MAG: type II toxin-antitoxin system prevent-host-death family antitoxin, partial [Deltaproteobacteria bacterium]|nr:type II toxin-antitoxin system prevent-host-death family antitoxin [Deltaproteobacteria bacterium]
RNFSKLLRAISHGETITVVSRGKPIATISPARRDVALQGMAKRRLIERLRKQKPIGPRKWTREGLYE